jgi:hypothetical protein
MSEKVFIQQENEVIEAKGETLDYILSWKAEAESTQEALHAEQDAKIAARQSALAKLAALGLTEEEIGAL